MDTQHSTAAVIGAGIAGTTAAYRLQQAGFKTTLFEDQDRVGGRIYTLRKGDFLMDMGTAVYLGTYDEAVKLIHEVGLTSEFSGVPAVLGMLRNGTTHHLDLGHVVRDGIRTKALSTREKLQLLKLGLDVVKHRKGLGYYDYSALLDGVDQQTVTEYCERTLSRDALEYVGRPLVSGTWVADADETSLGLLHWTIRNMLVKEVYNLSSGVVGLPRQLARFVETRLSTPVTNVVDTPHGVEVTSSRGGGHEQTEVFDTCVIATTAQPAIKMFPQMDDNTRELYESTRYRRLGTVCMGLSERPKDPSTFFLVAPAEDPDTIAVIADHHKAPGRAPEGKGLVTVLLSHEYLERSEHLSDEQVLESGLSRAARYYGDLSNTLEESAVYRWDASVPTIDRNRFALITKYQKNVDRVSRVQFASDLDRIPGLNGGLVSGQEAAGRVIDLFKVRTPTPRGVFREPTWRH